MYRGLSVTPFNQFFATSLSTNTRGHTAKIQKARCNLDVRRFFFSERVIDRWNRLQQEDIDVKTVNSSKTVLDRKLHGRWASLRTDGLPGPLASYVLKFVRTGAATPGKLPGKLSACEGWLLIALSAYVFLLSRWKL